MSHLVSEDWDLKAKARLKQKALLYAHMVQAARHAIEPACSTAPFRGRLWSLVLLASQKPKILSSLITIFLQAQRSLWECNSEAESSSYASTYRNSSVPDLPLSSSSPTPEI